MSHTILAISGSLRTGSSNTGLLHLARRLWTTIDTADVEFSIYDGIADLPFYNADLEAPDLMPSSVGQWRQRVDDCAGLFVASPEYNFGCTALLKNAVDWVSRPLGQHALRGKAISLMSSSSSTGGKHMIEQLAPILGLLGNTLISEPEAQFVKGAERIFPDGSTSDQAVNDVVRARLTGLVEAIRSTRH